MLARAPGNCFRFCNLNLFWLQTGPFVRTITKGLAFLPSTRAPPISTSLNLLDNRQFLENDRFGHEGYIRQGFKSGQEARTLSRVRKKLM